MARTRPTTRTLSSRTQRVLDIRRRIRRGQGRKGPRREAAEVAKRALTSGHDARAARVLRREVKGRVSCGIWWVRPVEWDMTHGRNPPSYIEIGAMRINRFAEQTKLETYGAPLYKTKKSKDIGPACRPHNRRVRCKSLPTEIWLQIVRYLIPTGGIFHCTSVEEHIRRESGGQPPELDKSQEINSRRCSWINVWHVMHHITIHKYLQHRFFPVSFMHEYKNLTAITRVSTGLNQAWNTMLYGENTWLLDLSTPVHRYPEIEIDEAWNKTHHIYDPGADNTPQNPDPPTGFTAAWPSVEYSNSLDAAAWPLTHRTARFARDLVISEAIDGRIDYCGLPLPDYESEHALALETRVNIVMDAFIGAQDSSDGQGLAPHSLRRLLVQIADSSQGPQWLLGHQPNEVIWDHAQSTDRRLRLSVALE